MVLFLKYVVLDMLSQRDALLPCWVHAPLPYLVCSICFLLGVDRNITPNKLISSADKWNGTRYILVFLNFKKFPLHSHCNGFWFAKSHCCKNTKPIAVAAKQRWPPFILSFPSFVVTQNWAYAVEFFSHSLRVSDGSKLILAFVQGFRWTKHLP